MRAPLSIRVPVREQLMLLIGITSISAVAVLAIATGIVAHQTILDARSQSLSVTATLKAAQLASILDLHQGSVRTITTRAPLQEGLHSLTDGGGNITNTLLMIGNDLQAAFSSGGQQATYLQASVFPRDQLSSGSLFSLSNVTRNGILGKIELPFTNDNGSKVFLGDPGLGYPPALYPNLTYIDEPNNTTSVIYADRTLTYNSSLILGPLILNDTASLISITVPIINNTSQSDVLGWLTVIANARFLYNVVTSPAGMMKTGEILVVRPVAAGNLFEKDISDMSSSQKSDLDVRFAFPPQSNASLGSRHESRAYATGNPDLPFRMADYPAIIDAYSRSNGNVGNAGAMVSTRNEEDKKVSVGYAQVANAFVDWVVVFEQSRGEVYGPINHLRHVTLASAFAVSCGTLLICFPLAHFSALPIQRLGRATEAYVVSRREDRSSGSNDEKSQLSDGLRHASNGSESGSRFRRKSIRLMGDPNDISLTEKKISLIPQRVPQQRHLIRDELTDLTVAFNEMSDELFIQYSRIMERSLQLERSRDAEKKANESKTLFIANISHELRTPLNGILGMCATGLHETSLDKVRQSLRVIYKSGDLLLHLLTDLLTFSKNQFGQKLATEETRFCASDLETQLLSIFEKQSRESHIDLKVVYQGVRDSLGNSACPPADKIYGPPGTGLVRDMILLGDQIRILQVLMNLVSNSLKFTPEGGSVEVRIRCIGLESDAYKANSTLDLPLEADRPASSRGSLRNPLNRPASLKGVKKRLPEVQRPEFQRRGSQASIGRRSQASSEISVIKEKDGEVEKIKRPALSGFRSMSLTHISAYTRTAIFDLAVEDTGPGIPEHMQKKVFEPFVQGDLAFTKKFGGTGLGLSICAQIAELLGGKITLKSTINLGSTFSMRIPLSYVTDLSSPASPTKPRQAARPNHHSHAWHPPHHKHEPSVSIMAVSQRDSMDGVPISNPSLKYQKIDEPPRPSSQDVPRIVGFSQPFLIDGVSSGQEPSSPVHGGKRKHNHASRMPNNTEGKAEVTAMSNSTCSRHDDSKPKILVAEDNKVNQQVIQKMLELESITNVTIAKDGEEALDVIRNLMANDCPEKDFDLVLMDIQMPNLDGLESTKLIRAIGYTAPIIALTAFADESNRERCLEVGMNDFLAKPIKRPVLQQVLRKYCTDPELFMDGSALSIGLSAGMEV